MFFVWTADFFFTPINTVWFAHFFYSSLFFPVCVYPFVWNYFSFKNPFLKDFCHLRFSCRSNCRIGCFFVGKQFDCFCSFIATSDWFLQLQLRCLIWCDKYCSSCILHTFPTLCAHQLYWNCSEETLTSQSGKTSFCLRPALLVFTSQFLNF